jgi:serine protease Do
MMDNEFDNNESYYQPQVNSYTPPAPYQPYYQKKEKPKYGIGAIIACCLICSILTGTVTSGVFLLAAGPLFNYPLKSTASTDQAKSINITVDKTATNLVEAIAEKVSPSVVGIKTTSAVEDFFMGEQTQTGEGSGIIYKADGYIITNYHVIATSVEAVDQQKAKIDVFLPSDAKIAITATVVGYDVSSDIAILKISKTGLPAIEIGNSSKIKVGEVAVAIGNPGGLEFMGSVSSGIISGLNRKIQLENSGDMTLIQTDAAINPGNSGGALVDKDGKLIGVNSAKMAAANFEGMGFAIPVNSVITICNTILSNKDDKKAYVGVQISTRFNETVLQQNGYPVGVVVDSVSTGSPASAAGIKRGDIITKFGGKAIKNLSEYNTERAKYKPGQQVTLSVYRGGQYYDVKLKLGSSNS